MKLCDLCRKNEAAMKVSQLDKDGNATELSVCADCARKRGLSQVEVLKTNVAELLDELKGRIETRDRKAVCPRCGLSLAEFKRQGRLGCGDCYSAFHEQLEPILRRLHGAARHIGKATSTGRKHAQEKLNVQWLRGELKKAIEGEDYEKAASLRDRLRQAGHEAEQ
jgi:protein arginine kinase activator